MFGEPISSKDAHHERLIIPLGLAVLASDALSSVAYATEEVLLVLREYGPLFIHYVFPISIVLSLLIWIVTISYRQTIATYSSGGGTYIVASENLGRPAALVAASALLTDYILTVAVSLSSGAAALVSMLPALQAYIIWIAVGATIILCYMNLRGAKESGVIFSAPTYVFIVLVLGVIAFGIIKGAGRPAIVPQFPAEATLGVGSLALFMLLIRAFSQGCTAMTGVEAIADGVQSFRPPEGKNAKTAITIMAALLSTMFIGISWCAAHYGIVPMRIEDEGYRSVLAQISAAVFGEGFLFYAVQIATALILFLAANTAFADFPRLCSFVARDKYLPRQLLTLGDRLVYHNGIILLSISAIILIIAFRADTHLLIPLYAVGVFVAFTLSQSGMAKRNFKYGNRLAGSVSLFGAIVTSIVTVILLVTKFTHGAWLILVVSAFLIFFFSKIRRHYLTIDRQMTIDEDIPRRANLKRHKTIVLVPRLHAGVQRAMAYATILKNEISAVHVKLDPRESERLQANWQKFFPDVDLAVLDSPYRSVTRPIEEYVNDKVSENPNIMVTVIVPQAVPHSWFEKLLHGGMSAELSRALMSNRQVVLIRVPYFLSEDPGELPTLDDGIE